MCLCAYLIPIPKISPNMAQYGFKPVGQLLVRDVTNDYYKSYGIF